MQKVPSDGTRFAHWGINATDTQFIVFMMREYNSA